LMTSALFLDITQRQMVNLYWHFGTMYQPHLHWTFWPLKMGPIYCPEMSLNVYYSTLRNTPDELKSHHFQTLV
jgi:hypothetical protein